MAQYIQRETYLQQLINRMDNGDIAEYTNEKGIRYIGLFQFLLAWRTRGENFLLSDVLGQNGLTSTERKFAPCVADGKIQPGIGRSAVFLDTDDSDDSGAFIFIIRNFFVKKSIKKE